MRNMRNVEFATLDIDHISSFCPSKTIKRALESVAYPA